MYEDTAIVLQGDVFVVDGVGKVIIHDRSTKPYSMSRGQKFNLKERTVFR